MHKIAEAAPYFYKTEI